MEEQLEMLLKRTEILMDALEVTKSMNSTMEEPVSNLIATLNKTEMLLRKRHTQIETKNHIWKRVEELTKICDNQSYRVEVINSEFPGQIVENQGLSDSIEEHRSGGRPGREVSPCPSNWAALDTPRPTQHLPEPAEPRLPHIPLLRPDEMRAVPGYMKGRLNCDSVNSFVAMLNCILKNKYSIVRLKRRDVKRKDVLQYCSWKEEQDEHGLTGKIYFTAEDITSLGKTKLDKTADKIIQVLRHLNRLRQLQVSGKKVIYILQS